MQKLNYYKVFTGVFIALWLPLSGLCACTSKSETSTARATRIPSPPELIEGPLVHFAEPLHLAGDPSGRYAVVDRRLQRAVVVTGEDTTIHVTGFEKPLAVGLDADRLFVGDAARGSVEVFDLSTRSYLFSLGQGAGEFAMPNDIAVRGSDGQIVVADSSKDRVRVYSSAGVHLQDLGQPCAAETCLRFPVSLLHVDDQLLVVDQGHHRVVRYDRAGHYLTAFGGPLPAPSSSRSVADLGGHFVRAQAITKLGGRLAVLDSGLGLVQVFTADGRWQGFLGQRGDCASCLSVPLDLVATAAGGLLVADLQRGGLVELSPALRRQP